MKTLPSLTLILGVCLTFLTEAQTTAPGTLQVKGKVVDPEGRPVEGAVVEVHRQDPGSRAYLVDEMELQQRLTTRADGSFGFTSPRSSLLVLARKEGLAAAWSRFMPAPGAEQRLVLGKGSVLAGVVLDEAQQPVSGADVSVSAAILDVNPPDRTLRRLEYVWGRPEGRPGVASVPEPRWAAVSGSRVSPPMRQPS
jgi:hypothetical protein